MTADLFESYLIALDALLARLGRDHALTADALLYQQRLQETSGIRAATATTRIAAANVPD
ncbi:MAG: hypothetical protein IPM84_23990 [Anaerolineae bacterium]|nr:hypothetical protein [Anaerolineae bacterium]